MRAERGEAGLGVIDHCPLGVYGCWQLFLKEDMGVFPYYYSDSDRIPPIVGVLDEGYTLLLPNSSTNCGTHG